MFKIKTILPLYEKYIQEFYDEKWSLEDCTKNQVINNLQSGYVFVKNIFNPQQSNECSCFRGTYKSNKIMYIYIFEYAYQLQQGIISVGSNVVVPENKSIDRISVEIYIKTLMTEDGNANFYG